MLGVELWYFAFLDLIMGSFKQPFSGHKILGAREKTEGDSIRKILVESCLLKTVSHV